MRRALAGLVSASRASLKLSLALLIAAAVVTASPGVASANPKYAAIVIDANTGKTLFASSADAPRYPASLTKMMTIYMIFEAMAQGRINRNSRVPFSAQAASRPPTKLGVRAGGSITVDTAIKALVTRSANDVAAAVGELIGGSEEGFARLMTTKARQLGMSSTTFRNASGLPNSAQRTTARDMAILGMALREHFPRDYAYFSTRSFAYGKSTITSHNRMFGRLKGVDGIKTGYIRASGFNLVTSVSDGERRVVAVVMGGQSARSRDDHMAALIREHMPKASRRGGGPVVASRQVTPGTARVAANAGAIALPVQSAPVPDSRPVDEVAAVLAYAAPVPSAAPADVPTPGPAAEIDSMQTASTRPSGWVIQVGSLGSEPEAVAFLTRTAERAPQLLADASGFTEVFSKGGATYYRARFGGFSSKSAAWNTCDALKKRKIACYAVQQ